MILLTYKQRWQKLWDLKKIRLENSEVTNRINVISNVVELNDSDYERVLENNLFEKLNNGFSRIDKTYKFSPRELNPSSPEIVKFTFENKGDFEITDIKILSKSLTNEVYQYNVEKCPDILPFRRENTKKCEVIIIANSNQKGVFEGIQRAVHDGIKTTEMDFVKLISTFSNSAELQDNFYVQNLADVFIPKSNLNTNFPINSKTPKIRLDISNKGNGDATLKEVKMPLEAVCDQGILVPLIFTFFRKLHVATIINPSRYRRTKKTTAQSV